MVQVDGRKVYRLTVGDYQPLFLLLLIEFANIYKKQGMGSLIVLAFIIFGSVFGGDADQVSNIETVNTMKSAFSHLGDWYFLFKPTTMV